MTYEEEKDAFLAHAGVKGMKWGKRKAQASGEPRQTFSQRSKAAGNRQVEAAGGSKKAAAFKIAGRRLAVAALTVAAQRGVQKLPLSPQVKSGVSIVAGMANLGMSIKDLSDATNLVNAD